MSSMDRDSPADLIILTGSSSTLMASAFRGPLVGLLGCVCQSHV